MSHKPKSFVDWTPEKQEEWRVENRAYQKRLRAENPEKSKEYYRARYAANPKKKADNNAKWVKANRQKINEAKRKRIAARSTEEIEKENQRQAQYRKNKANQISKMGKLRYENGGRDKAVKRVAELHPCYVASRLNMDTATIRRHPDLLKAKQEQILIKRALLKLKKTNKKTNARKSQNSPTH